MKRLLSSLLILGSLANLLVTIPVHAAGTPITTVKVTGYIYTKDGRVRPYASGSATIVSSDGYIVTNAHVTVDDKERVDEAFEICFTYPDNLEKTECTATAQYVAGDRDHDIAVLKIDPTDIFGKGLPALPFLSYTNSPRPVVGEEVQMIGYPDIGKDSATFTYGKVSGFLDIDGTEYFKSDAKISNGNSGGTTLNKAGQYIGIPSRGETGNVSSETLGYILPIADYREWLNKTIASTTPTVNKDADARLKAQMKLLYDASTSGKLEVKDAPGFSISSQPGWKFSSNSAAVNDYSRLGDYTLSSKDGSAYVSVSYSRETHEKSLDALEKVQHKNDRYLRTLPGYSVKKTMLSGKYPALEVSLRQKDYIAESSKYDRIDTEYRIPFGTTIVTLSSSYTTADPASNASDTQAIVDSFTLDTGKKPNFALTSYDGSSPDISLKNPEPQIWKMVESRYGARAPSLSLLLERPEDTKSWIIGSYDEYDDYSADTDYAKFFENMVKDAKDYSSLLSSGNQLTVAGRKTFFVLTKDTSSSNEDPLNPFVVLNIVIPDGKYYYTFALGTPSKQYADYVAFMKKLLATITIEGKEGKTDLTMISMLDGSFIDTTNHRFEKEIGALKQENVIGGYADRTFRPYKTVNRAEFLKMVVSALPKEDKEMFESSYLTASASDLRFKDVDRNAWYAPYLHYALDKGIVSGYADGTFRPNQAVTLGEGLKMLLLGHKLTVWKPLPGDDSAWELPYMDKAYELSLLAEGMDKPAHQLLRGEVAHIVYALRQGDKNKYGL